MQATISSPSFGALALTVALLGSTGCAKDPGASESSTAGTTTMMTSATESGESSGSTDTTTGDGDGDGDMTTTTNTSNTSGSFYAGPEVDFGPSDCDPFVQDCPEGEKCVAYASTGGNLNANKCVPILGDGQPGDPCIYGGRVEATDDCAAESYCWDAMDVDGETIGVCTEFCQGTPDDPLCPMGKECLISNDGSVNLCVSACDPVLQDCGPGLGCYWATPASAFLCLDTTQDIPIGEACEFINDCAPGLICWDTQMVPDCAGSKCCTSYCSLAAPLCPQMGTECVPFFADMPPMGYEDVGICVLPP